MNTDTDTSTEAGIRLVPGTALPLPGTALAASIREQVTARAGALTEAGTPPRLAVVTATRDESSAWHVRSIAKAAAKAGIVCDVLDLGPDATGPQITAALTNLGADRSVHGVILQTPPPRASPRRT